MTTRPDRPLRVLLVEDNPGDQRLVAEGLRQGPERREIFTVSDGEEALAYLRGGGDRPPAGRPDLILLDLNLPGRHGREVLAEIKSDPLLRLIPVVVLTSSAADSDIQASYEAQANCYVQKPTELDELLRVMRLIDSFWLSTALLPQE